MLSADPLLEPFMARYTDSRELVQALGREILAEGRAPTHAEVTARIRERTGTKASPNLVTEELQRFWALISHEIAERHRMPDVPAEVATSAQQLWGLAVEHAGSRWTTAEASLKDELSQARARADALTTQLDSLADNFHQVERALEEERVRTAALEAQLAQSDTRLRTLSEQLDALQAAHRETEFALGAQRQHNVVLEEELARRTAAGVQISQAFETTTAELRTLQAQHAGLEQTLAWQQQAHAKETEVARERLEHAKVSLNALQSELAQERLSRAVEQAQADAGTALLRQEVQAAQARAERLLQQVRMLERFDPSTGRPRKGSAALRARLSTRAT